MNQYTDKYANRAAVHVEKIKTSKENVPCPFYFTIEKYKFPARSIFDAAGNFRNKVQVQLQQFPEKQPPTLFIPIPVH